MSASEIGLLEQIATGGEGQDDGWAIGHVE
jgi:hypothetical protein